MPIADGLDAYHQTQQNERDRLAHTIARFQADIDSMKKKLDGIEGELPDLEAALRKEGREPKIRPKPVPVDPIAITRKP